MSIQIKGLPFHPNTSFEFTASGMFVRVSLNIPPDLVPFTAPENTRKSDQLFTYGIRLHIQSKDINKNRVKAVQEYLLNNCMRNIRTAKVKQLNNQIEELKRKEVNMKN